MLDICINWIKDNTFIFSIISIILACWPLYQKWKIQKSRKSASLRFLDIFQKVKKVLMAETAYIGRKKNNLFVRYAYIPKNESRQSLKTGKAAIIPATIVIADEFSTVLQLKLQDSSLNNNLN